MRKLKGWSSGLGPADLDPSYHANNKANSHYNGAKPEKIDKRKFKRF